MKKYLKILIIPLLAFWGLTFDKNTSTIAVASGKPQILKFSSTMCLECKEVEKVFKELLPKYKDKIDYTEIIVDNRNDMKNTYISPEIEIISADELSAILESENQKTEENGEKEDIISISVASQTTQKPPLKL